MYLINSTFKEEAIMDEKLKATIPLMESEDWKERIKAEYMQLCVRLEKLESLLKKYDDGELEWEFKSPVELLRMQADYMHNYKGILEQRATYEGFDLN